MRRIIIGFLLRFYAFIEFALPNLSVFIHRNKCQTITLQWRTNNSNGIELFILCVWIDCCSLNILVNFMWIHTLPGQIEITLLKNLSKLTESAAFVILDVPIDANRVTLHFASNKSQTECNLFWGDLCGDQIRMIYIRVIHCNTPKIGKMACFNNCLSNSAQSTVDR